MNRLTVLCIVLFCFSILAGCGGDNNNPTNPAPPNSNPDPEPEPEETTGALEVTISTSGIHIDSDGYNISVEEDSLSADSTDNITFDELEEGTYEVVLSETADNCNVDGNNPKMADISAGDTTSVAFDVSCTPILKDRIIYTGGEGSESDLYIINPDGTGVRQFANTDGRKHYVDISPDGMQVVYRQGGNLIAVNGDGSQPKLLTTTNSDAEPAWSPDGSKIAFVRNTGNREIFVMNADGSNQIQLTNNSGWDGHPTWSSDGSTIAFHSDRDGDYDIYTIDSSGSTAPLKLTDTSGDNEFYPEWSPDGSKIAYAIHTRLYVMDADGSNAEFIFSESSGGPKDFAWSPDGSQLALQANSRNEDGSFDREIYLVNADGSGSPINLTKNTTDDLLPDWSPLE